LTIELSSADLLGFFAAGLVLTSFGMREMLSLRMIAMASNVAFISYGLAAHLLPVMVLHTILLPVNLWHVIPVLRRNFVRWQDQNEE
jgi:CRP/FNR family transcriptional regulator, cyclic AMP receptor protein